MLEGIGYGPREAAGYAPWASADDAVLARVLVTRPGLVTALTEQGPHQATPGGGLLSAMGADPRTGPCVGDWVVLRAWPDHRWTVEAVLPRRTTVGGGRTHAACCANIDALVVLGGPGLPAPVPAGVDVVPVSELPQRIATGETVAVVGGRARDRAALVRRLAGTTLLAGHGTGPCLLPVPGGGALLVVGGTPWAGTSDPGPGHGATSP